MTRDEIPAICVVTQPLGESDPTATRDLLAILSALTSVSLVTIALSRESSLWDEYEVVEVSADPMGGSTPVAAFRFVRNQLRMARTIRQRDEEIVLFYGSMAYLLPILAARLSGKTVVTEPRADVPLSLKLQWERQVPSVVAATLAGTVRLLERTGYRLSDAIIAYSPGMADQLDLYTYEEKLYTNGARFVDTEKFTVETPFEERDQVVGYVGRFAEEKGIRTLAAVAKELPECVTFRFVGDGPLRGWLEDELSAELEDGSVEIRGWIDHDEVPSELNELRLLVMPSEPTEGLPTLILEAMVCGTPVYATPVSGVVDVVIDDHTGYHIDNPAPRPVVDRITDTMEDTEQNLTSEKARQFVVDGYSFGAAVTRYRDLLKNIATR